MGNIGNKLREKLGFSSAQKLTIAELRKAAEAKGEHLVARALDDVVLDRHGDVDLNATVVKFRRRALLGKAAAASTGIAKPVSVGDQGAGPRGSGPEPRPSKDAPGMTDRGGPFAPRPIPGIAQHDIPRLDARHSPQSALDAIRTMVRRAHP